MARSQLGMASGPNDATISLGPARPAVQPGAQFTLTARLDFTGTHRFGVVALH